MRESVSQHLAATAASRAAVVGRSFHDTLQWYRCDEIMIGDPRMRDSQIVVRLVPRAVSYGLIDMPYYTAAQLTLALSQTAYVLTGAIALDEVDTRLSRDIYDLLLEAIPTGKCLILELNWRFRREVLKQDSGVAEMQLLGTRRVGAWLLGRYRFVVQENAASAAVTLAMPIPEGQEASV